MEKAVEIGLGGGSLEQKTADIGDFIGAGLHVSEAVPAAIGFFVAAKGNPMDTLYCAVNVGYDTDTIATMCGAIAGAFHGSEAFPGHFLPTLEKVNDLKMKKLARVICNIADRKRQGEFSDGGL